MAVRQYIDTQLDLEEIDLKTYEESVVRSRETTEAARQKKAEFEANYAAWLASCSSPSASLPSSGSGSTG